MTTGKLLLKWEDFTEDIRASYHTLRNVQDFADVTLACEDGVLVEAHKVILAASSSVFANILQSQKHPHPLLFLRGLSYNTISDILDFIYYGEVKIEVEQLNGFIAAAEDLKLKGISSKNEPEEKVVFSDQSKVSENRSDKTFDEGYFRVLSKKTNNQNVDNSPENIQENTFPGSLKSPELTEHNPDDNNKYFVIKNTEASIRPPSVASTDLDNDTTSSEENKSDILSSDNIFEDIRYDCTVCGKFLKSKHDLRYHAEIHLSRFVDKRPQALKATRRWQDDWMVEVDRQGDRVGDWAQQADKKSFRCRWCNTTGQFNSRGKHAFIDHSSSGKHERIAAGRKGKLPISAQPNPYN